MKHIFLTLAILFFSLPTPVTAHTLKTDGEIGAVLHISPEDDPIAGEISSFYFEIKDTTEQFTTATCECTVTISKNGETLLTQPVFAEGDAPDLSNATMIYTFPKIGIYDVTLTGVPLQEGTFDNFSLSYDVRVAKSNNDSQAQSNTVTQILPVIIPLGALLFIGVILFVIKRKKTNRKKGGGTDENTY